MSPLSFGFALDDVLVVTGAGSGIGRATTLEAARQGLRVVAWDLVGPAAAETAALAEPGRVRAEAGDVADAPAVRAVLEDVASTWAAPRYLANNAGPSSAGDLAFEAGIVAALGSVHTMTEAWAALAGADGAAMVVTASVAGTKVGTESAWYSTAKAGLAGYVRHLAAHRADRFRSNAVAPGMVDTPRLEGWAASAAGQRTLARNPLRRLATPADIAHALLFLLSPAAAYVNGEVLTVDGGWTVTQ
ncbi:SDR family oxidoreductase [Nocardioides anomalus]|uniref:SDR family oxidoreductase n=1 Tax=Nocardioides anomalus TaxID=2712223 RepID=A0A6G6WIM4_9ACTN|nr:SDR family oxidoreductase [Nocardioides anomalus]QIG45094.1 SDR family oxidoreductase [Nocardioides anomalus]